MTPLHLKGAQYAVCWLPDYQWEDINGFTPEEIAKYEGIIRRAKEENPWK